ncbi:unnamed protein product [Phytophthora lilii]|uniref:Unnamed protein product n=1 Tax=Phytophthora lilii TaxID=2077276 RepID=A0A9W6WQU7_9STRA|nr:unnamed protein product [Phytophthora lilii]
MPRGIDSVYDWVGKFSFSRPMKNPARDFSDAGTLKTLLESSTHRLTTSKMLLLATANSPFLQAKHAFASSNDAASTSPRSRSSSTTCSPPSTPSPGKQKLSPSSLKSSSARSLLLVGENSQESDTIATSFSKLLQLMSDTTGEVDEANTFHPQPRRRADTVPRILSSPRSRRNTTHPLTPNYAKPTLSTLAMARPASVDSKARLPQATAFVFPQKYDPVFKASFPETRQLCLEPDKKHLPSDTNEFLEGSFVYFLSSEALPASYSFGDLEDQAQVARVIKTLPSGECMLQLFRRIPSNESPQNSPNKTRCYFATPHFIDCCSTLLHTIPTMDYDPHTNMCEWRVRTRTATTDERPDCRSKPNQNISPPPHRHFYTEVLTRVTLTKPDLTEPTSKFTESVSTGICVPCPRFAESFRVPVEPTIFPKVRVNLVFELPDRFPRRSRLPQCKV